MLPGALRGIMKKIIIITIIIIIIIIIIKDYTRFYVFVSQNKVNGTSPKQVP